MLGFPNDLRAVVAIVNIDRPTPVQTNTLNSSAADCHLLPSKIETRRADSCETYIAIGRIKKRIVVLNRRKT